MMISKTDLFLKVSAFKGDNTPSAPRSTVIGLKIPPFIYRVLLVVEEVNHTLTLYNSMPLLRASGYLLDDW